MQLYLNKDREISSALIRKVEQLGAQAIVFTVDVCWQSKRTLDVRSKETPPRASTVSTSSPKGVSEAISGYQDSNMTWKDIDFIRVSFFFFFFYKRFFLRFFLGLLMC
jgi:L-lactate dehydrogenase (cytochrome)